jgi:hypothetical protein
MSFKSLQGIDSINQNYNNYNFENKEGIDENSCNYKINLEDEEVKKEEDLNESEKKLIEKKCKIESGKFLNTIMKSDDVGIPQTIINCLTTDDIISCAQVSKVWSNKITPLLTHMGQLLNVKHLLLSKKIQALSFTKLCKMYQCLNTFRNEKANYITVIDFSNRSKENIVVEEMKEVGNKCKKIIKLILDVQIIDVKYIYLFFKNNKKNEDSLYKILQNYPELKELHLRNVGGCGGSSISLYKIFMSCMMHPKLEIIALNSFTVNIKNLKKQYTILGWKTSSWKYKTPESMQFLRRSGLNLFPKLTSNDIVNFNKLNIDNISNVKIYLENDSLNKTIDCNIFNKVVVDFSDDVQCVNNLKKLFNIKKDFEYIDFKNPDLVMFINKQKNFFDDFNDITIDGIIFRLQDDVVFNNEEDIEQLKESINVPFFRQIKSIGFNDISSITSTISYSKKQNVIIEELLPFFPKLESLRFEQGRTGNGLNILIKQLLKNQLLYPNLKQLIVNNVDYDKVDFPLFLKLVDSRPHIYIELGRVPFYRKKQKIKNEYVGNRADIVKVRKEIEQVIKKESTESNEKKN